MKWNSLYCTVWYCTVTKQNYTHGQKSWDTFAFLARFPIHTGPTSPLTHKQCRTRASRIFSQSKLCMGLREEGEERNAKKISKRKHCLMREPRMTEKYEYRSLSQGLLSMIVQVWFQDNCFFEWFLQCALSTILFLNKMGSRLHMSSFFTASLCFLHLLQYRKKNMNKININLLQHNFYLPNFTHPPQQGQHKNLMNFPRLIS